MSGIKIDVSENAVISEQISANLQRVRERVSKAAERSGRSSEDVLCVAVSKTWPADIVQVAVDAGALVLGENRVQEAQQKVPEITGSPQWHLVGHLQRNKARVAVGLFDTIQSVDSAKLAKEIGKHAVTANKEVSIQLQVNTSGETSKSGVEPDVLEALIADVIDIDGIRVEGLMTIATNTHNESEVRRCFQALRDLRDRVATHLPGISELSMGMTGDFELAIEEGATVVRVGTAIFGSRN